jgi:hypothetical protein
MAPSPSTTENAHLIDAMTVDGWDRDYVVAQLDDEPGFAVRWLRHYGIA